MLLTVEKRNKGKGKGKGKCKGLEMCVVSIRFV
jgi:hypothetical protein